MASGEEGTTKPGKELVVSTSAPMPEKTAGENYQLSADAARVCREIVIASAQNIKGKKYVKVEGWQAIAIAHGCTASSGDVERTETGFRAIGKVIRMSDGMVLSQAEGFVGDDEETWGKRPEYARRAMAQTRASSRACRSAFAHVVVMMNAGLSTTPAEEMVVLPHEQVVESPSPTPPIPESRSQERRIIEQTAASTVHAQVVLTGIDNVTFTEGANHKTKKPWKKFKIHAGEVYQTFSETFAKEAKRAKDAGLLVEIEYKESEYGREITGLAVQEPTPQAQREEDKIPF